MDVAFTDYIPCRIADLLDLCEHNWQRLVALNPRLALFNTCILRANIRKYVGHDRIGTNLKIRCRRPTERAAGYRKADRRRSLEGGLSRRQGTGVKKSICMLHAHADQPCVWTLKLCLFINAGQSRLSGT